MRIIVFLILTIAFSLTSKAQQWNSNGDNATTGALGVGTISPTQKLHVNDGQIVLGSKYKDFIFATQFWNRNSSSLYIAPKNNGEWDWGKQLVFKDNGDFTVSGKVGIGIKSPQARLHVKNADNTVASILAENSEGGQLQIKSEIKPDQYEEIYKLSVKDMQGAYNNLILRSYLPGGEFELKLEHESFVFMNINNYSANFKDKDGNYRFNVEGDIISNGLYADRGRIYNDLHVNKNIWSKIIRTSERIHIGSNASYDKANNYKLSVEGKVIVEEVKVQLSNEWADFVFYDDYKLPTLKEVENYIVEKGHLKDIPSAKEVAEEGVFLGQMDAKLLQKIEELTLYTIAQEKEIRKLEVNKSVKLKKLEKKITSQDQKIELLLKRLDKLEASK